MRLLLALLFLLLPCVTPSAAQTPPATKGRPVAFTNVTVIDMTGAAARAGALLLAGTDASGACPVHGFSLHDELELLVRAGLTPFEALRAATYNPAKYLGRLDSLGTVEPGKLADLLLLDADPLADVRNTRRINSVVAGGRYFSKESLEKLLAGVETHAARE